MRTREFILVFFILDMLLLNGAIMLASMFENSWHFISPWPPSTITLSLNMAYIITYLIYIDDMQYLKTDFTDLLKLLIQRSITFLAIAAVLVIAYHTETYTRVQFLVPIAIFTIGKMAVSFFLFYKMSLRKTGRSPMIIVGNNKIAYEVYRYCKRNKFSGYKPLGILSESLEKGKWSEEILGTINEFQDVYDKTPFNDVIISLALDEKEKIKELIHLAEKNGVKPRIVLNWYDVINHHFHIQSLGAIPLLDVRNVPLHNYSNRFWKRAFDLVFTSIALILLLPVFIIIAILIKLDSPGPIFYTPVRLGVNGKPFKLYKFRSMSESDDALAGTKSTVLNDKRVTRLGKFLRKSNLDELPQLYNVLMNEMSIVGPRPHRVHLNRDLQKKISTYMVRHFVKPGITGWAQVNGWRGPTENRLQYMGRTLHDIWYIENWSFFIDIYIIFLTAFGKKTRKNAF